MNLRWSDGHTWSEEFPILDERTEEAVGQACIDALETVLKRHPLRDAGGKPRPGSMLTIGVYIYGRWTLVGSWGGGRDFSTSHNKAFGTHTFPPCIVYTVKAPPKRPSDPLLGGNDLSILDAAMIGRAVFHRIRSEDAFRSMVDEVMRK